MNAYKKLDIHKNPEFKDHLKNIEALDVDLFNKEKILAFGEKYDIMPEDVKEVTLDALSEIKNDEGYKMISKALFYCLKNDIDVLNFKPDFEEGLKAEFALFFPVWYVAEDFAKDMEKRGVSFDIISKSLAPICGCTKRNKGFKGIMGTSAFYTWIGKYAKGELFRINDFEYETFKHNGENVINIHIPSGTALNVKDNLKSFKGAVDFFEKYYPELKMKGLFCESWLLSEKIEEIMGKKTNISRFGDMFDRFETEGEQIWTSVLRFVYGFSAPYPPIEELPENTTLQKKMKEYMLNGGRVYNTAGFISMQKLFDMLSECEE